jgi:hypothetical protein
VIGKMIKEGKTTLLYTKIMHDKINKAKT